MTDGIAEFKAEEAGAYDEAAERFAALSERYAGDLAARLVEMAEVGAGARVLDVGTGAGVVAAAAAPRVGPEGRVLGVDISEAMLSRARGLAAARGLADRVDYRLMDAESLAFEDQSFDRVVSLFALLHMPHPLKALQEMRRVLRPGGRLAVGVGSGAPVSLSGLVHRFGRLGGLWKERRGRRLVAPRSLETLLLRQTGAAPGASAHWADHARGHGPHAVPRLVREAGFADVQVSWEGRDLHVSGPEEFWDLQRTFSSLARRRLAEMVPAAVDELRREMIAASEAVLARGGDLVYPQGVLFVHARQP
jgi:SAM-dependent methyltransferase